MSAGTPPTPPPPGEPHDGKSGTGPAAGAAGGAAPEAAAPQFPARPAQPPTPTLGGSSARPAPSAHGPAGAPAEPPRADGGEQPTAQPERAPEPPAYAPGTAAGTGTGPGAPAAPAGQQPPAAAPEEYPTQRWDAPPVDAPQAPGGETPADAFPVQPPGAAAPPAPGQPLGRPGAGVRPQEPHGAAPQSGGQQPFGAPAQPGAEPPTQRQAPVPQPAPAPGTGAHTAAAVPQPAPAPGHRPGPGAPGRPAKRSRRPLLITLIAVGLVVLLGAIGAIVVGSLNRSGHGPDRLAQDYLTKLADGDVEGAAGIAQPQVPEGTNEALLEERYYGAAQEKMSQPQVTDTKINGDDATISTTYMVGTQEYSMDMAAHKDGKEGLFFDKWKLDGPVLQTVVVSAPTGGGAATVNGEQFDASGDRVSYAVYPGSYELQTKGSTFVGAGKDAATVGFAQGADGGSEAAQLTVSAKASKAFAPAVKKAVESKLSACAKQKGLAPKGCPFFIDSKTSSGGVTVGDDVPKNGVTWKVAKLPKLSTYLDTTGTSGSFSTSKPLSFSFKADSKKAGKDKWSGSSSRTLGGSVKISGDKLDVEFFGANK